MRVKTVLVSKTLAAVNADVRPLPGVYSRVRRKMMFQKEGLAALGAGVRSFFRRTGLTSHVLLFDLGLDLRGVDMSENMAEMRGTVRLAGCHVVGGSGLIGGGSCPLHQDFIALFRREL